MTKAQYRAANSKIFPVDNTRLLFDYFFTVDFDRKQHMESVDTDWGFPFRGLSQHFCTHQKQGNQGMFSRSHGLLRPRLRCNCSFE